MIPLRLCFMFFQILILSYSADALVMLTANSQDVSNIARKFLSESLTNKIAEFIAKSSNIVSEHIADGKTLNETTRNNFGVDGIIDMQNTKNKERHAEDIDNNQYVNRKVKNNSEKPVRTTHKWREPFKNTAEFQHNNTEYESNRDILRISSWESGKNNTYKTKPRYLTGDIEHFKKDLMKVDMHYHKPSAVKMVKTKLEPIPEYTEEDVGPYSDTREDKSNTKNYSPCNKALSYKPSSNKSKTNLKASPVSSLYVSELDANKNKVDSFIKRDENKTNVENQLDKSQTLFKEPKLRQPNLKYKKRYHYVKASLRNQNLNNKLTKFKRFKKASTAKQYYKMQPEKLIKNPNWSEEPEPQEKKQRKRQSKKSFLRDQLKFRYYPHHNYYYPIKPKVVPGKIDDPEVLATKTTNKDKSINENKETITAGKNIVAHFLTTKNPTIKLVDDNTSTTPDVRQSTTEFREIRITTAKDGKIMGTRSTVHGYREKQDMTHDNKASILEEHKNKELPPHQIKNAFNHDKKERYTIYHKPEKTHDIASSKGEEYKTYHLEDEMREVKKLTDV